MKAFDSVSWKAIHPAFARRAVPRYLQAAYIRQLHSMHYDLYLPGGLGGLRTVSPANGIQQGHPSSPLVFAAVLADAIDRVRPYAEMRHWGFPSNAANIWNLLC